MNDTTKKLDNWLIYNRRSLEIDFSLFIYFIIVLSVWLSDATNFILFLTVDWRIDTLTLFSIFLVPGLLIVATFFRPYSRNINIYDFVFFLFIILYLIKLPFPDSSHDVKYYSIWLQSYPFPDQFSWHYLPAGPHGFLYPLGEKMFYVARMMLGYRLGTILNIFVMLVIYFQLKDIFCTLEITSPVNGLLSSSHYY